MRPLRVETEQLHVKRVRQPGQRVPIERPIACKRPVDRIPTQAVLHMRIRGDILVVIEVEERMMAYREIQSGTSDRQQEAEQQNSLIPQCGISGPLCNRCRLLRIAGHRALFPHLSYFSPASASIASNWPRVRMSMDCATSLPSRS